MRGACKGRPFIMEGRQKETRRQPGLLVTGFFIPGYACGHAQGLSPVSV